jgi:hypothetical protein
VYFEPDVVPLHHFDIFIMDDEPERQAQDEKQGEQIVNSSYFIFLEFFTKFYQANFSTWANNQKIVGHTKNRTEPAREPGQARWPGPISLEGPSGGSPQFFSRTHVFDFHVCSENFREIKKRKRWVLGHSFLDYLKERDWSSGIHPNSHPFAPALARAAAMMSLRRQEVKLGVEKPLEPVEVKPCELKPTMEIERTARIRCGGCVPTGPIASRHPVNEEKVSTSVRRSERL